MLLPVLVSARIRSTATLAVALVATVGAGAPVAAMDITWPRKQYDPSPAGDDVRGDELVLPMPCGGAMVFRRIRTRGPGWLGERTIELGSRNLFDAPLDQRHVTQVAGAFDDPDPGAAGGGPRRDVDGGPGLLVGVKRLVDTAPA